MSGGPQVFVDGAPAASHWAQDRAFQYGDGLFETMRVRHGRIRFLTLHQARLAEGCRRLAIEADTAKLWAHACDVASSQGNGLLKLQLSRGDARARGYAPAGTEVARSVLWTYPESAGDSALQATEVVSLRQCLGENPGLAGLKHCNRLEQVLARAALAPTGAFEGLMASSSGQLISGTMSNVYLELEGELLTPALDRCGVAGVMREVVLREAARRDIPLRIADVDWNARGRCSAMALSNARIGLVHVDTLDGRRLTRSAALATLAETVVQIDE